ncbi:acyltransferase domain-containing protein [Dactylosporangium sp. NBC_01737]|uniref:type I polyketide synthase n=1 Tax=Dactylosporangium sp. NBC_01737 TaxID=2975959 RepID=UPI002E0E39DF|nr:acyltransferase domain-containing protein [Dactylosporangium sp. NBC_01737]
MTEIAVIGMAGRLPGADTLDEFWHNLLGGRDGISRTPAADLRGLVPDDLLDDPRWVGASGRLSRAFDFDAAFFRMSPKEALITDPQHRLLLSVVHDALEDACVVPERTAGTIGVFTGVGRNRHEELVRGVLAANGEAVDELALEVGNDKDHSATKVAYRLGLCGPAITVQSACSTGLVALHQAGQSLGGYECDVAVVAAATMRLPDQFGYLYLAGGIGSPDGYCRPFSTRASGTVSGDGVVSVVLKRLDDARADGDRIYAVVRGSAVNNDGAKSGYAMVSAEAQERVIRDALLFAEVDAEQIGAVEAHGSGTPLGDAVEWAALSAVYGGQRPAFVGSVKSSIGHVREVSGLAGFVRMVRSVHHGRIPPTLHVGTPAQAVGRGSGLQLARVARDWADTDLRRGAISSFGLGGTNVHVIVEQPPLPADRETDGAAPSLVLVSASSAAAADRTATAWRAAVTAGRMSPAEAADVSQFGRRQRRYRRFGIGHDGAELAAELDDGTGHTHDAVPASEVCFVFPGVGDHYPGMCGGLAELLPGFADLVERYLSVCSDHAGRDLRGILRAPAAGARRTGAAVDLRRLVDGRRTQDPALTDPVAVHAALFSVQLALARSLRAIGVQPAAVTGHSLGELAAAASANMFSDDDALRIVVARAALVAAQPEGVMLAVSLPRTQAEELTGPGVWLAAVNSPRSCVLAGERPAVMAVADRLDQQGMPGRLLPARHAFHTPMLDDAGRQLAELLADIPIAAPDVAMIANLTGTWSTDEIRLPGYWHRQLTAPVLFSDALRTAAERCGVLLEIGPGQLRTLVAQARAELGGTAVVATVRREYQNDSDAAVLLRALGRLWQTGTEPDWQALRPGRPPKRVSAPPTATDDRSVYIAEGWTLVAPAGSMVAAPVAPAGPPTAAQRPATATADEDPDELRTVLAGLWREILGVADLGPAADFFELGGDSMMSVRLLAGIERTVGVRVPATVAFEASSLEGMAKHVGAWRDGNTAR